MSKVNKSKKRLLIASDNSVTTSSKMQKVDTKSGNITRTEWTGEKQNSTLRCCLFKRDLIAEEFPYKDGKIHGTVKKYFPEPVNSYMCDYDNGVKHGYEKRFELTDKLGLVKVYECVWDKGEKNGYEICQYNPDTHVDDDTKYSCKWIKGVKDGFERGYFGNMLNIDEHDLPFSKYSFYTDWEKGVKTNSRIDKNGRHSIRIRTSLNTGHQAFYFAFFKDGVLVSQTLEHKNIKLSIKNRIKTFEYTIRNSLFEGCITPDGKFNITAYQIDDTDNKLKLVVDDLLDYICKLNIDFDYLNNIADHRDDPDVDLKLTNIYNSLSPTVLKEDVVIN